MKKVEMVNAHVNPLHTPSQRDFRRMNSNGEGKDVTPEPPVRTRGQTVGGRTRGLSNLRRLQSVVGQDATGGGHFGCSIRTRILMERAMNKIGKLIGKFKYCQLLLIVLTLGVCIGFAVSLDKAKIETSVPKLWVEAGGRLDREADYIRAHRGKKKNLGLKSKTPITCADGQAGGGRVAPTRRRLPGAAPLSILEKRMVALQDKKRMLAEGDISYSSETSMGSFTVELFIIEPKQVGADVVSTSILTDYLNFVNFLYTDKVEVENENGRKVSATLNDLCAKIRPPKELSIFTTYIPCTRVTVLDCFEEGGYDFDKLKPFLPLLREQTPEVIDDYGVVGYDGLPSLKSPKTDLHQVITDGCHGFARKVKAMKWDETMILGSPKRDKTSTSEKIQHVSAYQHIFGLAKKKEIAGRLRTSEGTAQKILDAWNAKLLATVDDKDNKYPHINAAVLTHSMLREALRDASSTNAIATLVGILVMAGFIVFVMSQWHCSTEGSTFSCGLSGPALVGMVFVIIASFGACGFAAFMDISFNATSLQVLPFLALGLGVDDMFILIHTFSEIERYGQSAIRNKEAIRRRSLLWKQKSVEAIVGELLSRAGPSVSMTSFSNFAAFMVGSTIPLPAVQTFCFQAAFVVAFNYIVIVFGFTAVLALHETYQRDRVSTGASAAEVISDESPDQGAALVAKWVETSYMPFLLQPKVKAIVLVFFLAFTGLGVYGISIVEDGLDVADIAPRDSYLSKFLGARFKHFSNYEVSMITGDMDYPCRQADILAFQKKLATSRWVHEVGPSWLDVFLEFVRSNRSTVNATKDGLCPPEQFYFALKEWDSDLGSALDTLTVRLSQLGYNDEGRLIYSPIKFTVVDLYSTEDYNAMIEETRAIFEKADFPVFPEGSK